jgi:hypothetical protein
MPEILRTNWYVHFGLATMPAFVLTRAEPDRNTGLVFNCLKKESWCCAYVGDKGLSGWSSLDAVNTTCCAIDDLTFKAEDPVVYATATAPVKLIIQATSTVPATAHGSSTLFSSTSLSVANTAETNISGLPTAASSESPGNNTQDQSSPSSPESLSTGAKIGLGVGIPLAVIGLGAIAAFFWLQRRRKAPRAAAPAYHETPMNNQQCSVVYRHEASSETPVVELPAAPETAELPLHAQR